MTESSRDEEIGRAYQRMKKIGAELDALRLAARRIGNLFNSIGNALLGNPDALTFENEGFDGRFRTVYSVSQNDQKDISVEAIRKLTNDYRKLLIEKEELEKLLG